MKVSILQKINNQMTSKNLDVRVTNDARFFDQKVTPDVLCAVCECIIEYLNADCSKEFTKNDIWHSEFAQELITTAFSKPDLSDPTTNNEYDKFFSQPLKALAYANVLSETQKGRVNVYTVNDFDIVEFISQRERNALEFLSVYLTEVMNKSGIWPFFHNFFEDQSQRNFESLRKSLMRLFIDHTAVSSIIEPPRIFNKIINILSFANKAKGSLRGRLSEFAITLEDIRYNKQNWRDIGKDRRVSRKSHAVVTPVSKESDGYLNWQISKAKKMVKKLHQESEVHRFFPEYNATQAHHIFMASEFPELAAKPENIIALTPNQHFLHAHPNNKTTSLDREYQVVCLLSKFDSIESNIRSNENDYSLEEFAEVLNTGFETDEFTSSMGYELFKHSIVRVALRS